MSAASWEAVERHRKSGRLLAAGGVESFTLDHGDGEPVVLMHGVPASSFLYRKVVDELAARDLRAIAFDLPGLGLAERPPDFDYSWTGLGEFARAAVEVLRLDRFHLVVHDIGGPIGFELAAAMPERIASLTILNTLIEVEGFTKPWVMRPFGVRGAGEIWLASVNEASIVPLMWLVGVKDRSAVPSAELAAYSDLLKRGVRGRAFLKIMRGFETTREKQQLYVDTLRSAPYPVQIVWGADDTALPAKTHGAIARRLLPDARYTELRGKHFFQEDQAPALAGLIAGLATGAR